MENKADETEMKIQESEKDLLEGSDIDHLPIDKGSINVMTTGTKMDVENQLQEMNVQLVDLSFDDSQNGARRTKSFERKPIDVTLSHDDGKRMLGEYSDDWNRFASVFRKYNKEPVGQDQSLI
ncbi:15542_t:CDS:2 [Funneliformis mosseae]|uniref:15542_t:CDS:1 n=1 Tax=Funneliformis mosseae TaxID=27381 RepID=A0A9N9B6N2_FUNMO|nr:15542_t:CDS:2 [Funneliformis mosseae]